MSCHRFSKYSILAVILTCRNFLVPYYRYKIYIIVETEVGGVDNITTIVKEQANATNLHQEESILICK